MNWINVHCRVRNESVCYIVFFDRTKPDNSVRINPATRHPETKYGFVVLTGDMIFKDFFVGVKLLLRHEHLSSTAASDRCLSVDPSKPSMAAELIAQPLPNHHLVIVVVPKSPSRERHVTRPSSYETSPSVRGADLKPAYEMPAAKARARVDLDLEPRRFP
jgi:hypothetical protein